MSITEAEKFMDSEKWVGPILIEIVSVRNAVADLRGGRKGRASPSEPNFFHFHAVFGKNWANSMLAPSPGVGAPPLGNPRSATD